MNGNDFISGCVAASQQAGVPMHIVVTNSLVKALPEELSSSHQAYIRHFLCWNSLGYLPEVLCLLTSDLEVARWAIMAEWVEPPVHLTDAAADNAEVRLAMQYISKLKSIPEMSQMDMISDPVITAMSSTQLLAQVVGGAVNG